MLNVEKISDSLVRRNDKKKIKTTFQNIIISMIIANAIPEKI